MRALPTLRIRPVLTVAVALLAGSLGLAGCGDSSGSGDDPGTRQATLVLDFVPGPVHAGIFEAVARGYYAEQGIDLEIVEPTSTADTLKLIGAGKAAFGIADGIDVAVQIDAGLAAKGVLALTQRPLGGLIALRESGFRSPADLEGTTVGITGVPSDEAVLDTLVSEAGADPTGVERVTIGFKGIQLVESGKIDAMTGFIPSDAAQIEVDGFPTTSFALDRYGGPRYPGLVVFSTTELIEADPALIQGFVSATVRGYEDVVADPQTGLDALLAENPGISREFAETSLDAYLPLFVAGAERFGEFDPAEVEDLSTFLVDRGLLAESIEPDRYATNRFVERVDRRRPAG